MKRKGIIIGAVILAIVILVGVVLYGVKKQYFTKVVQNTENKIEADDQDKYRALLDFAEGQVEKRVSEADGWKAVERGEIFKNGMEIRTLVGSKAVLTFEDGSIARLDENTQIKIKNENENITLEMPNGSVFNRVAKNDSRQYIVSSGEYNMRALGTIFSVSNDNKNPELIVLESEVEIQKNKIGEAEKVQTGEKAVVNDDKIEKKKVNEEDLGKKFIAWNMEKDKLKASEIIASEKSDNPFSTGETAKISLSGKTTDSGVKLSWEVQNISDFDGFKIVKSKNSNPVYPGDAYVYFSNTATRSYNWNIVSGEKYHFRVCKYSDGKCVLYSNDIYLDTPEKSSSDEKNTSSDDYATKVSLSAKKDGKSAKLSWSISGGDAPKGFKVLSSKNKNPEYPTRSGDSYQYLSDSDVRNYTWSGFSSGKTYHFRVCVYKGGSCGAYSNDVEIEF